MSKTKYAQKIIFFYCYKCKDYELKTSPHYRAQKQRFARRRKAEKSEGRSYQMRGSYLSILIALALLPKCRKPKSTAKRNAKLKGKSSSAL